MIVGGIADKLGNRYEAKWTVRSLIDVVANKAEWLLFESIETEFQGFEFAIGRGDITEWHQTKINAPNGNWTINALKKEGVLKAFANRLSTCEKAHCYFVSQDNAKDLRSLTKKARISNLCSQFKKALSQKQLDHFSQLQNEWQQSDKDMYNWLRRSFVEIFPEKELDSLIESYGDLYFHNGAKTTFPNLRNILEEHFNKTLTAEYLRATIKTQGALGFKDWAFDTSLKQRLIEETDAYLQTYAPFGVGGLEVERDEVDSITDEILEVNEHELVLLSGVAGSGKSGVVRELIHKLRDCGIPHLAFRVDQYLSCDTKEELGEKLTGRKESPASTLKGMFPSSPSVLIVDQVDAVSEVSGRESQMKEVLFRLIADTHNFGGLKIVVVCRAFDLDGDPRLKALKEENRTISVDVPLFDWTTDVEPALRDKGFNATSFNEPQRKMLCLPVNLAVFLEINDPAFSFQSRSNLHEKLIEKKQRIVSKRVSWPLVQALTAMSDWMSERQQLNAPASVLDAFPKAIDILSSEGMIISSRGKLNFFHESFFDHVYARAYVNNNQSLVDFLTSTEQYLFRRTQTRQILEALRQNDFQRYLTEVSSVLLNSKIRYHIKVAISQWLSSVDKPSKQEFEIIVRFNELEGRFHQFFRRAVLSTDTWFEMLYQMDWIHQQMEGNDDERVEAISIWLTNAVEKFPTEVTNIWRSWWMEKEERAEKLLDWMAYLHRFKANDDLLTLCKDVIDSRPANLFEDRGRNRILMLLENWGEGDPEACGQVLHAIFDAWFALHPGKGLFERGESKLLDTESLNSIVKKAPKAFLEGSTDAIILSVNKIIAEGETGNNWYYYNDRTQSEHPYGFDAFVRLYRLALKNLASKFPEVASIYLNKLASIECECFIHLQLEAIQANPEYFAAWLPSLTDNEIVFNSGYSGAEWLSFAHACRSIFPHLETSEKKKIEQMILDYYPELKYIIMQVKEINEEGEVKPYWTKKEAVRELRGSGYKQWCILETIGENILGMEARSKLSTLRRKLPNETIEAPRETRMLPVQSPIKRPQSEKMKDEHWLNAIKHYDSDEYRRRGRGFVDGGARDLARELQEVTKKDAARFSNLSLSIPDEANHVYIEYILSGLAEVECASDQILIQAIKRAHQHPSKPFGQSIARILEKHPLIATCPKVMQILIWYALNGKANHSDDSESQSIGKETLTINTLIHQGGRLHIRGVNGERGWAWEAIAAILWEVPEVESLVWKAMEESLENEPLVSVRCCMLKALVPLFNMNKDRFSNSIQQLIILPDSSLHKNSASRLAPLITLSATDLFPYIFHWLPVLAEKLVTCILEDGDENQKLIGTWHVFCESFRNKEYIKKADALVTVSTNHRRLLADVAAECIAWTENRDRAKETLKGLFFDEDEQVRKKSADAFRKIPPEDVGTFNELITIFLSSPAFTDNAHAVLNMLKKATSDVLELTVLAAQKIISGILENGQQLGHRGTHIRQLQKILEREYVSSESNPKARKIILDLIDKMFLHEVQGADSIVTSHDRW